MDDDRSEDGRDGGPAAGGPSGAPTLDQVYAAIMSQKVSPRVMEVAQSRGSRFATAAVACPCAAAKSTSNLSCCYASVRWVCRYLGTAP